MLSICAQPEKIYLKDAKLKREDVQILQEWLKKQAHLPELAEIQVMIFLNSCYYSIEASKSTIDIYFTTRTRYPHVFSRLPLDNLRMTSSVALGSILSKTTPQGYFIFLMKLMDFRPENFNLGDLVRHMNMVATLYLHQNGPADGVIALFDVTGLTFGHLARLNLVVLKHLMHYVQDAIPLRIKGIHFINAIPVMDKVLALLKPLMNSQLFNLIQLHTSLDSFFKYVPRECMPVEYGGEAPSSQILQEETSNLLLSNYELFEWHDSQIVDEYRRLEKSNDPSLGIDGTFKKLEID